MVNRIDELCRKNRTGVMFRTDVPSGKMLYEIKMVLNTCRGCECYKEHRGGSYCLQPSDDRR